MNIPLLPCALILASVSADVADSACVLPCLSPPFKLNLYSDYPNSSGLSRVIVSIPAASPVMRKTSLSILPSSLYEEL